MNDNPAKRDIKEIKQKSYNYKTKKINTALGHPSGSKAAAKFKVSSIR